MVSVISLGWSAASPKAATTHSGLVVMIDAGHGGKDPGTRSRTGVLEKYVTLAIAEKVAEALRRQGVTVIMTRQDDSYIGVAHRADMANQASPALFVSLHCDANADRSLSGYSIILAKAASRGATASANDIAQRLKSAGITRHAVRSDNRGLAVLNGTTSPAVLVEAGFLSNAKDAARLMDTRYQAKIGAAIAGGILDYLPH